MARYLTKSRALFQHVPRTGGSWVEKAIDLCGIERVGWLEKQPPWLPRKHALLGHYHRRPLARVEFVFAFVRHPIPYYESTWKWLRANGAEFMQKHWTWHPHMTAARHYHSDFNRWVEAMLNEEPLWYTRLIEQYVGPEGGEFVDWIGRTETMTVDLPVLLESLGYRAEVKRYRDELQALSNTNVIPERIDWSPGLPARVERAERSVIERFCTGTNEARRFYCNEEKA